MATHLARAFNMSAPGMVQQVYARRLEEAKKLSNEVRGEGVSNFNQLIEADLTIIAIKDDAIVDIATKLSANSIVVHTSGSKSIDVLSRFKQHGILYPLQTFSASRELDMRKIPFFIETSDEQFESELIQFCKSHLSPVTHYADSERRATMHLAAVMASNFSNQLLHEAAAILSTSDLPLSVLQPLMIETVSKAFDLTPVKAQTGPAKRNDKVVIDRHLDALKDDTLKEVYRLLTTRIQKNQQ